MSPDFPPQELTRNKRDQRDHDQQRVDRLRVVGIALDIEVVLQHVDADSDKREDQRTQLDDVEHLQVEVGLSAVLHLALLLLVLLGELGKLLDVLRLLLDVGYFLGAIIRLYSARIRKKDLA